jgi:hypothetical protein
MRKNLYIYQVNTTAWKEEDFLLLTSLTEEQITKVLTSTIKKLRDDEDDDYDNDFLVGELERAYPDAKIVHYTPAQIDYISI